jgi:SAM-dependent methyltransferase
MTNAAPVLVADQHVHRLYAQFARLPVGVVTQCAASHSALVHGAWHADPNRSWAENARALFEQCDEYVFELLHAATTRAQHQAAWGQEHVQTHFLHAGPLVLDFGGGLGLASSLLADAGKRVTYCDVDGPAARFANWFFAQVGNDVESLRVEAARPQLPAGRQWDIVLAEHVLEHVADPVATVELLVQALRPQGVLHVVLPAAGAVGGSVASLLRPVDAAMLLAGSSALRALGRVELGDDQHLLFRRP